jgi:mono/diheme cytochrome c family protein
MRGEISSSTMTMRKTLLRANLAVFAGVVLIVSLPSIARGDMEQGKRLYQENCTPCHGKLGKGDGDGARSLPVRPADHTNGAVMSGRSDAFLRDVITKGGSAMGLSSFMPAWQGLFKDSEILDLVSYVRSLASSANKIESKR